MARCGWCITNQHQSHRPEGTGWRCDCEECDVIYNRPAGTRSWTFVCDRCGFSATDTGQDGRVMRMVHHRCKEDDMTILGEAWEQIDAEVKSIYEMIERLHGAEPDEVSELEEELSIRKARAKGKAEILALLMTPFFETADQISEEARLRYLDPTRDTPGLTVVWKPGMGKQGDDYPLEKKGGA